MLTTPKTAASFTRLRAKGAFLVSADYDGTTVSGLNIFSEKGGQCRLSNPWKGEKVQITENGNLLSAKRENDVYSFETKEGNSYVVTCSQQ